MSKENIFNDISTKDKELADFVYKRNRAFFKFSMLYRLSGLFKRCRLIPAWVLLRMYRFIRRFFTNVAVFYYIKDSDDVGLAEIFLMDESDADELDELSKSRQSKLGKVSFQLNMYGGESCKEKYKKDQDDINVGLSTREKKIIWAQKAVEENNVLTCFAFRILKQNEVFFNKLNRLYRLLRCSLFLRAPKSLKRADKLRMKIDVEKIAQMVNGGF